MASYTLSVVVVCANGLSGTPDSLNTRVELRFAGQKYTTTEQCKVRHPVWNETIHFKSLDKDKADFGTLEAYVYNVIGGRKSLIGRVRIPASAFSNSNEVSDDYRLRGGIFPRSKGTLHLKVSLKKENPMVASDPLNKIIPPLPSRSSGAVPSNPVDFGLKEIKPTFAHGMIVEDMPYVFVHVVKGRHLQDVDARGRLDPYVEVKIGDYRATTENMHMHMEQNPEWNITFAFSKLQLDRDQLSRLYVVVNDLDMVRDDFEGMVWFDVFRIRRRLPNDKPLVPQWYRLFDKRGNETEGELMLAVWMGSQADEAFPGARKSDSFHLDVSMLPHIGQKVYDLPRMWYLRVWIIELECVTVTGGTTSVKMYVTAAIGDQLQRTRSEEKPLAHYFWNHEFLFVAAEPFEDDLQICVQAVDNGPKNNVRSSLDGNETTDTDKVVAVTCIALEKFQKRVDSTSYMQAEWFDLEIPQETRDDHARRDELSVSSYRIRLASCLEGGYNVLYDPKYFEDDFRPASKEISEPPVVGSLDIGIIKATGLPPRKRVSGESTLHPYCVAKYGRKWVRTRTVYKNCSPEFNEQYGWEVYDSATVITIGVFDNAQLEGYDSSENKATNIGKVRIRLSLLQPGRTYAHAYPLIVLLPTGVTVMGELHLALRFSSKSLVQMLRLYASPSLPKMQYRNALSVENSLRHHAVQIVGARFSQIEPPLWKEVVEYMCDINSDMFSLRKIKANFFRSMQPLSTFIWFLKWFDRVCSWKNPATTLLVHAVFVAALLFHELIFPSVLLYIFFKTVWNYRRRPSSPPHFDIRMSCADAARPDELDEEFDTSLTSTDLELVRMRYDRLRSIAGRVQTVVGDIASQEERIQSLVLWRDPTATSIFAFFTFLAAIVLYFTPWKILVAIAGFYAMRHPLLRWRTSMSSLLLNFFFRLPQRTDYML